MQIDHCLVLDWGHLADWAVGSTRLEARVALLREAGRPVGESGKHFWARGLILMSAFSSSVWTA
jgi:hypothetical protein